jgi:hypothetical protein
MPITHTFVSAIPDEADTSLVRPSDWNAAHVLDLTGMMVFNEVPAGTLDGANDTFTLAQTPNPAASLVLTRNRLVQRPGGLDFTLTGLTIVFAAGNIPQVGDDIRAVQYWRL